MKPKQLYAILAILGAVLPLWHLVPFVQENGLDIALMFKQLFSAPVSAFFGTDVIVASVVLWVLIAIEGRRAGVPRLWLPVLASIAVGVSLALPLFLFMRESRLEHRAA
jgi:hypothetical protein